MKGNLLPSWTDARLFGAQPTLSACEIQTVLALPFRVFKESTRRAITLIVVLGTVQSSLSFAHAAQTFEVQLNGLASPEILTINQGDTVVFHFAATGSTECYTGEWVTPTLQAGQTFTNTFTRPGIYAYRVSSGVPPAYKNVFFPGFIRVQGLTGAPPAIWITRPLDQFIVPGYTDIEAATTNSPQTVEAVSFYADGRLVGRVTNTPYVLTVDFSTNLGTYNFTASVVDIAGVTHTSAPVRITFSPQNPLLFQPYRLPQGQTVIFESAAGGPFCLYSSEDLTIWHGRVAGQLIGNLLIVDESTTNLAQRFYYMKQCL